jgi:hypothetical protein
MSLGFTAVGGVLVFGRRWLTLDVANRDAIRRQGLLVPMHHEQRPLSEFNSVVIALETDSESADKYPIRLRGVTGNDLPVCSSNKYEESFQRAEFLALSATAAHRYDNGPRDGQQSPTGRPDVSAAAAIRRLAGRKPASVGDALRGAG